LTEQPDELAQWIGQDLYDANRVKIGVMTGLGFARRKFGSWWLSVESTSGNILLVPAEPIRQTGERLTLPYVKGYVESGPAVEDGQPLSKADERRLAVLYGFGHRAPTGECVQGCGLCMATRRADRRHEDSSATPLCRH
jgi:hypothetical protein